jgi:hypothetical protein
VVCFHNVSEVLERCLHILMFCAASELQPWNCFQDKDSLVNGTDRDSTVILPCGIIHIFKA